MQPAQPSLLPAHTPAPATNVLDLLPPSQAATAIAELARLIAQMSGTTAEVGDDG